jgi:hypothetical protein
MKSNQLIIDAEKQKGVGAFITTKDAYTLTDGPTIFITEDVKKIADVCIRQAHIPAIVMDDLRMKIDWNNKINDKIAKLEKELEMEEEKKMDSVGNCSDKNARKFNREDSTDSKKKGQGSESVQYSNKIMNEIANLKVNLKRADLHEIFVPNKMSHVKKWGEDMMNLLGDFHNIPFTSNIDENMIEEIMLLNEIEDSWKILLMMGIGVFISEEGSKSFTNYLEIMKRLVDMQCLYLIIASSDYIYGTNYQFCHAYIGKDLNLTQEKIIQAMGRVGRSNIQQTYTIRFRDIKHIKCLFQKPKEEKIEVRNMRRLFCRQVDMDEA